MRKIIILALMIPFLSGCIVAREVMKGYYQVTDEAFVPTNYFVHPEIDRFKIRRVLVAPFKNETQYSKVDQTIEPIFNTEFARIKMFEILPSLGGMRTELKDMNLREKGTFYKLRLYDVGERYNVDAVIFITITDYFPYEPCRIGISAQMIHTYSGVVVWALSETYDSNLRDVESLAKQYYFEKLRYSHPLFDWRIMTKSMRYFARAVASNVAETLLDYIYLPRVNTHVINTMTIIED